MFISYKKILFAPRTIYNRIINIRTWIISCKFNKVGKPFRIGRDCVIIGGKYIQIGKSFSAHARTRLEAYDRLSGKHNCIKLLIGENVCIGYDCHIGAANSIEIGDNVLIASRVYITDHSHGSTDLDELRIPPLKRKLFSKGPVVIEDNVWIGEGVVILPNVVVGKGAVIGANAVVTKDVLPFSIVGGIPAKVIRADQNLIPN